MPQILLIVAMLAPTSYTWSMSEAALSKEIKRSNLNEFFEVLQSENPTVSQIRYYLENGVPIDYTTTINDKTYTVLQVAAMYGHTDICNLLIDKGAGSLEQKSCYTYGRRKNAYNKDYLASWIIAAGKGHLDTCKLLLEKVAEKKDYERGIDRGIADDKHALRFAIKNDHLDICKLLLERGAEINKYEKRSTLDDFSFAVKNKRTGIVEYLLKYGVKINIISCEGTPLWIAINNNDHVTCNLLLQNGADPNAQHTIRGDFCGYTPLMLAAQEGYTEICDKLLEYGADIFDSGNQEENPLVLAAKNGNALVCETLINSAVYLPNLGPLFQVRAHIKTFLLCLKRACPKLPRDMRYLILISSDELRDYITRISLFLFKQGKAFPASFKTTVLEELTTKRIKRLLPHVDDALALTDDANVELLLNTGNFEGRFRDAIHDISREILKNAKLSIRPMKPLEKELDAIEELAGLEVEVAPALIEELAESEIQVPLELKEELGVCRIRTV